MQQLKTTQNRNLENTNRPTKKKKTQNINLENTSRST